MGSPDPADRPDPGGAVANFPELCRRFRAVLDAAGSPLQPLWPLVAKLAEWKAKPAGDPGGAFPPEGFRDEWAAALAGRVEAARHYLPLVYQDAYVAPLLRNLGRVVRCQDDLLEAHNAAETLAGAVAQHLPGSPVRHPLQQFLAVVSNLYRSFLSPDKRVSAEVPLAAPALPPLAAFHHGQPPAGPYGPAVFTSPMTRLLCGSEVAVVVMPASLHRAPLTWVPLAHEAGGHGILQADPDLLPDLVDGVRAVFGGGLPPPGRPPTRDQALGLLWSHWAEEAASDVYAVLNVGPAFAVNLAAFLAATRSADPGTPVLAVQAGDDPRVELGPHPVDLLRLHLAVGVTQALAGLAPGTARGYVRLLEGVARVCGKNAWAVQSPAGKVVVRGRVAVERDRWVSLDLELGPKEAAESARRVGAFIATTRLGAIGNRTVQDLETWDETDEAAAREIARELAGNLDDPPVREWEYDPVRQVRVERRRSIREALAVLRLPAGRPGEVIDALKNDRFDALTPDERTALGLDDLDPDRVAALQQDRIEALPDPLARAVNLDSIAALGDDAQLLAGSTLAAIRDPSPVSFRWINRHLAYALTRSFRRDAWVGQASAHHLVRAARPPLEAEKDPPG
jgi:hypothetical protein